MGERIKTTGGKPIAVTVGGDSSGLILVSGIQEKTCSSFSSLSLGFLCLLELFEVKTFALISVFSGNIQTGPQSLSLGTHISSQESHDCPTTQKEITFAQLFFSDKSLFICFYEILSLARVWIP